MGQTQMKKRCPDSNLIGKAILKDYALDFTISAPNRWKGGGCADVVESPGSEVWGLLYEVSDADISRLDEAEGPRYRRVSLPVSDPEGKSVPYVYVYEVIDKAPFKEPAREYIDIIKNAAYEYGFPETYQQHLASIPIQT